PPAPAGSRRGTSASHSPSPCGRGIQGEGFPAGARQESDVSDTMAVVCVVGRLALVVLATATPKRSADAREALARCRARTPPPAPPAHKGRGNGNKTCFYSTLHGKSRRPRRRIDDGGTSQLLDLSARRRSTKLRALRAIASTMRRWRQGVSGYS